MEEGDDIMEHLNGFNTCITNLLKVEVKYDEEDKALLLLQSLPLSFKHFRITLKFRKGTLKYEEVSKNIISHVKMNKNSGENSQEGLNVKDSSERGRTRGRDKKSGSQSRSKSKSKSKVGGLMNVTNTVNSKGTLRSLRKGQRRPKI